MRQAVVTQLAPAPVGAYSQGAYGRSLFFVAGQGPADPQTGALRVGIEDQTRQAINNIREILAAAGLGLDDVVKVNAYLADFERDFPAFDAVYRQCFSSPFPARTSLGAQLGGILIEIEAVAVVPSTILVPPAADG
jgi:2-iminobutanoate/2-iminopropanoate deaminase